MSMTVNTWLALWVWSRQKWEGWGLRCHWSGGGEAWTGQLVPHSATVVSAGAASGRLMLPVRRENERMCVWYSR